MKRGRTEDPPQDETDHRRKRMRDSIATASKISDLPNELIIYILTLFRNSCSTVSDYLNAVTCCKQWAALGASLAYADLVLDNLPAISAFTSRFPEQHLRNLTSLTIVVKKEPVEDEDDAPATPPVSPFLLIPIKLAQMTRLKTFSLTIEDQPLLLLHASQTDSILQTFVEHCLERLPQSVINVELSTSKMRPSTLPMGDENWPGVHLCKALNNVLPRLHRLSLQLRDACPQIFGTPGSSPSANVKFPHLREVFFDISSPMNALIAPAGSLVTRRLSRLCHADRYEPRHTIPSALEMVCQCMLRDLRTAIEQDAFPSIQTFTIHRAEVSDVKTDTHGFIHILDLVANTTASIPTFLEVPSADSSPKTYTLHIRNSAGTTLSLIQAPVLPFLPDLGAWYSTSNGARLPGIHNEHEYAPSHDIFLRTFRKAALVPNMSEGDFSTLLTADRKQRELLLAARAYRWDGLLETDLKYGLFPRGYKPVSALVAEFVVLFVGGHLYSLVVLGDTRLEPVE
ncbi:F-box domain containing protein [Macrophomina phaseolina MS6]|uniref:F-box domain containing protein n=1 Tax=Macrophomina phaseolina (strain MS6) TaxID=1126212 RepID=K2SNN5_MACPH|nr:F-box domain containing protein [Macrophomina phaseolina MS6]